MPQYFFKMNSKHQYFNYGHPVYEDVRMQERRKYLRFVCTHMGVKVWRKYAMKYSA